MSDGPARRPRRVVVRRAVKGARAAGPAEPGAERRTCRSGRCPGCWGRHCDVEGAPDDDQRDS